MILYNWSTILFGYLVFLPDFPFLENKAINSASDKGADGFGKGAEGFGKGFDEADGGFNPDFS